MIQSIVTPYIDFVLWGFDARRARVVLPRAYKVGETFEVEVEKYYFDIKTVLDDMYLKRNPIFLRLF